jgi:Na+/melibiose symporter-like transporter
VLEALDDPLIGHWCDNTRSRWGRRLPFVVAGTPLLILSFVLLWFPPPAPLPWTAGALYVVLHVYSLAGTIVHFVLPNPILSDVVDDGFLRSGMRRGGMYFAAADPLGVRLVGPIAGLATLGGVVFFGAASRLPDRIAVGETAPGALPRGQVERANG